MARIESVCVYCGSASGSDPLFAEEARRFGQILAAEGVRLVYGGGGIGLMGEVAGATALAGGAVTGIIPRFLMSRERAFAHEAEMIVVEDMHARKRMMFERADAFVALPGGVGTLEELVEQLTWAQLGRHRKPILIANIAGFWDPFLSLIEHMRATAFIREATPVEILAADRMEDILPRLREAAAAVPERVLHAADSELADRM
ncbi:TIGR00730 family Rossman fold protein [Xanthobacter autotrophicus]|uniref:LOG family protein n=1 Tax=Xanthobacter TaxID=279 RepID=UPI0024AC70D2|nr:TIGR00730 family Rossman fold protein [Xanthobacter autotrophicus]MDI4664555.1 TIGR00730 family Rossman fold protein [Xanthobacter autotrophicus]